MVRCKRLAGSHCCLLHSGELLVLSHVRSISALRAWLWAIKASPKRGQRRPLKFSGLTLHIGVEFLHTPTHIYIHIHTHRHIHLKTHIKVLAARFLYLLIWWLVVLMDDGNLPARDERRREKWERERGEILILNVLLNRYSSNWFMLLAESLGNASAWGRNK